MSRPVAKAVFKIAGSNCLVFCLTAVDGDAIRAAMACKRLSKETLCSRQVTVLAEEELDRVANTVDGTVEIHPLATHLDVGFVKVPLPATGRLRWWKYSSSWGET